MDDSDNDSEISISKKRSMSPTNTGQKDKDCKKVCNEPEPQCPNSMEESTFKSPKVTEEFIQARQNIQGKSSSSGTGEGCKGRRSSDDTSSKSKRRQHTWSTSSTDLSSSREEVPLETVSMESNIETNDRPMTGGISSVLGDGCTSGSSVLNLKGETFIFGDQKTIKIASVTYNIRRTEEEGNIQREEYFLKQFNAVEDLFVETRGYIEAETKLNKRHHVLITGSSGEGKSFIAMKLVNKKMSEGYSLREVDNITQWREQVQWRKKQVVLIDDLFGFTYSSDKDDDNQRLITNIGLIFDDEIKNEDCLFVIMTCRKSVLSRITEYLKSNQLLDKTNIVDLSDVGLLPSERTEILDTHLAKYRANKTILALEKQKIIDSNCPIGYPNCVHMFTKNDKLFDKGSEFFTSPIEYVRKEIHRLHNSDADVYALLVFLLIRDGEIKESTLNRLCSESDEFYLLQNIVHFPTVRQFTTRLKSALKRVDDAFISQEGMTIQFTHSCVLEAVCLSFSETLEHEAIKWLPFQFIVKRVRTTEFKKSIDDEVVTIRDAEYENLSARFIEEIKRGNIVEVCKHQAFTVPRFVNSFIGLLESLRRDDINRLRFILQVTEQEKHQLALFNGSLLYWASSLNALQLCLLLLSRKLYDCVEDKFWVRIQASAAFVPACWYGFPTHMLKDLINLTADVNSSIHEDRVSQTHFCDWCTVHDREGMSAIQATVFGENLRKHEILLFLLAYKAKFKVNSNHRPLVRAVKNFVKDMENSSSNSDNSLKTIATLLDGGIDINWKDAHDRTAIWYSVVYDNIDVAKLLISKTHNITSQSLLPFAKSIDMVKFLEDRNIDKDFKQTDGHGKTLLHRVQHESLIQYFINKGCSIKQRDKDGRTPIFYSNSVAICKKMLEMGDSIRIEDFDGKTVLHFIKNIEIIEFILQSFPEKDVQRILNTADKSNRTPIFTATSLDVIHLFIKYKASVNYQVKEHSISEQGYMIPDDQPGLKIYVIPRDSKPLKASSIYCANYLKSLPNICPNLQDDDMEEMEFLTSTLCPTMSSGSSETNVSTQVTRESTEYGIESSEEDTRRERYTIGMKLALNGKINKEIVQDLIDSGADFSLTDDEKNTFFHYMVSPDHKINDTPKLVGMVLKSMTPQQQKRIVNQHNSSGNTVLHLACSCTDVNKLLHSTRRSLVSILLNAGAVTNIANHNGETPLHCLFKCTCAEKFEIGKLLNQNTQLDLKVFIENRSKEIPLQRLCCIQDQSNRFTKDAQNVIKLLYNVDFFKDFFLKHIEYFLTNSNVLIIETVYQCCQELSQNEIDSLVNLCSRDSHKFNVRTWIILSLIETPNKQDLLAKMYLQDDDRHIILTHCISKIQEKHRRLSVLNLLLTNINDINEKDSEGRPLLINALVACRYHRNDMYRVIKLFLKFGADPNIEDKDGLSPSTTALCQVQDNKANLEVGHPLILAVQVNRLRTRTIRFLPSIVSPDEKDETGNAIHHLVVSYSKYGHSFQVSTTTLTALVERGVDINMYNDDGETPLHVAMRLQVQPHVVIEMLRNGADVNREKRKADTSLGSEPMEICDSVREEEISNDQNGKSSLQYMLVYYKRNSLSVVREMLKYGADLFQKDTQGRNSFHIITTMITPDSFKILLLLLSHFENSGVDKSIPDKFGNTPLHYACTFGDNDDGYCASLRAAVVRILIAKGWDMNMSNSLGQTPFHILVHQYHQYTNNLKPEKERCVHNIVAIMSILLATHVDLSRKDADGKTVLDYIDTLKISELKHLVKNTKSPEDLLRSYECTLSESRRN
ncbi:unnamed protein product [Mytilus coruscus]|uniref:Novel STAND NTPase 3 domain-containing protein n=1 Tax=Mytilus coruscus TaxID=42192 RepID=A0A6J8EFT1_MYTCO|nr:unnamed protein product [Mytilus coruscus]